MTPTNTQHATRIAHPSSAHIAHRITHISHPISRITLLFIILLAFFLRMWQLPVTPPGLWYDEAYNALDAMWMAESGPQIFFPGNNGREPMWHYLVWLSTWILGNTTFAVRLVGALAGVLTIPVICIFAHTLAGPFVSPSNKQQRAWFALAAAGWLAVSWWHIHLSRAGFRPVLLPLFLMLSLYFFWKGIQSEIRSQKPALSLSNGSVAGNRKPDSPSTTHPISHISYPVSGIKFYANFALSGLFLGLTQYTYLPARLVPLIFVVLAVLWLVLCYKKVHPSSFILHHLLAAAVATLVFAPLGLYYFNNPEAFSSRTGDVMFNPKSLLDGLLHLAQAVALFFGAGHELYRHHLPGRAMLGWLEIIFFWAGLIFILRPRYLKRPETQLLLISFGFMWLPALLAQPPIHALRPVGLIPFYYLIVTIGLYQTSRLLHHSSFILHPSSFILRYAFPIFAALVLTLTLFINSYDYFQRWANHPETYKEYNGPLVDLTTHLLELTQTHDVIIPLPVYVHPVTRYLLWSDFAEADGPPPDTERPVEIMLMPDMFQLLYVGNIPPSPAMALLARDETGQGKVYVSRPPRGNESEALNKILADTQLRPFTDKLGRDIAFFAPVHPSFLQQAQDRLFILHPFDTSPLRTINLVWADQAELLGYDVTPQPAQPGQPITLNLYWRSLTDSTFDNRLFLQLIDSAGNPINQLEDAAYNEDMYRWRPNGILPTQHTLWLGPDTPPGAYLVRLGFFNPDTQQRLPLSFPPAGGAEGDSVDQVQLGLFYVSPNGSDPRQPATPLSANFANSVQLIGVTLPNIQNSKLETQNSKLPVTFHWQSLQPTTKPYTVFLQLLNQNGDVISAWDSQPLNGLYPTNLWSPGEIVVDTFPLPLPEGGLPPGDYTLITGFYDFETFQRLPVIGGADFAVLAEFGVE